MQKFTLPPSDAEVTAWAASLKTSAPHFFPPQYPPQPPGEAPTLSVPDALWERMSPGEKLALARQHGLLKPAQRRPPQFEPSPEQAQALAAMPVHERLTAFRRMQTKQGG